METAGKRVSFAGRMLRAARLDSSLYEEVEADRGALTQAMLVVVLSSIAAGIGSITRVGVAGLITSTVAVLASWFIWAFLVYIIGAKLFATPQTRSDIGELLRTIGFSSSPGLIRILGIIPGLAGIVFFVAGIWMLVAMVVAVRQALDFQSTFRAIGVVLVGWVVQALFIFALFTVFGGRPMP